MTSTDAIHGAGQLDRPDSPRLHATIEEESRLIDGLKGRDEASFIELVDSLHGRLLRTALNYVRTQAVAEEVVQDTWIGVLRGIDRFEHRCSLRTWVFGILLNRARTAGRNEGRYAEESVSQEAPRPSFANADWSDPPQWQPMPSAWQRSPEELLLDVELRAVIEASAARLPIKQREVVMLRDMEGFTSHEVRWMLGLSESNQRVLLHRARTSIREALNDYLADDAAHLCNVRRVNGTH
jgi:RNA polymerase sigma-70 factor, ECF subfamily